jgi:hypothetical protein
VLLLLLLSTLVFAARPFLLRGVVGGDADGAATDLCGGDDNAVAGFVLGPRVPLVVAAAAAEEKKEILAR